MNKKKLCRCLLAAISFLLVLVFSMMIKQAGDARQARLAIGVLKNVVTDYYKTKSAYPKGLNDLPSFYAASVYQKFYLDSHKFAGGQWHGYQYDLQSPGDGQFVISASPVNLWPRAAEFGITQEGILKVNTRHVDKQTDSYEEVTRWQAFGPVK